MAVFKIVPSKRKKYYEGYARFDDRIVTDEAVAEHVKKHLRFLDRLDIRKVTESALQSFSILSGSIEEPAGKWYYYDDLKKG